MPAFPALHGDLSTEVAVVGAGLAGILTAFFLQQAGKEVLVLEADRVCGGATEGTTAKITAQHGLIYDTLIQRYGEEKARQYASAQQRAIAVYADLVREKSIACDFERKPAYLYSVAPSGTLARECRAAERLGLPASLTGAGRLPFPAAQAMRFEDQAQFHPLRFAAAIARNLHIREHARVVKVAGDRVITESGTVRAKKIVVCTHFPIRNAPGFYFARMHQSRSYVVALENAPDVGGMWLDAAEGGYSLRNAGGLLLLGGASHRCGEHPYASSFRTLKDAAKEFYPAAREVARWSAQDCMTPDSVPFIGRYARSLPDVYVATGFNKWGMTGSMVAAELLAGQITSKSEYPYAGVFSPRRWSGVAGKYTLLGSPKCPHLGCALEWNPDTRTLDCPCHGSRFTRNGRVVSGPAVRDGKWRER